VKVLSIRQPWAARIVEGLKALGTRNCHRSSQNLSGASLLSGPGRGGTVTTGRRKEAICRAVMAVPAPDRARRARARGLRTECARNIV